MPCGFLLENQYPLISMKKIEFENASKSGNFVLAKNIYHDYLGDNIITKHKTKDIFIVCCINQYLEQILWMLELFIELKYVIYSDSYITNSFYNTIIEKGNQAILNKFINVENIIFDRINPYDLKKILGMLCYKAEFRLFKNILKHKINKKYVDLVKREYIYLLKKTCDISSIDNNDNVKLWDKNNIISFIGYIVKNPNVLQEFIKYDLETSLKIVNTKWLIIFRPEIVSFYTFELLYQFCMNGNIHNAKQILSINNNIDITSNENCIFRSICTYLNDLDICNIYIDQFVIYITKILEIATWISSLKPELYFLKLNIELDSTFQEYNYINNEYLYDDQHNVFWNILKILEITGTVTLSKTDVLEECPICYDKKVSIITNCNHKFCKECIEQLYRIKSNIICPICRKNKLEFKSIELID